MEDRVYLTYWDHNGADTFLCGSTLRFHENRAVEYENSCMNAGVTLRTWYSQVNYQDKRLEPQLPIPEPGRRYELHPVLCCEPAGGILLRVNYYDRKGTLLCFNAFDETGGCLECPDETDSWTLELVQAGSTRFWFHHIEIRPLSLHMLQSGALWNADVCSRTLNILLPDLSGSMFCYPDIRRIWGIPNFTIAPTDFVSAALLWQQPSRDWIRENKDLQRFTGERLLVCGAWGREMSGLLDYQEDIEQEEIEIVVLQNQSKLYEIELS